MNGSHKSKRRVAVASIAAVAFALIVARFVLPSCESGRACVRQAGISVVLPEGWSGRPAKDGELFVAAPSFDESGEIVIDNGSTMLEPEHPANLDELEKAVVAQLTSQSGGFSTISQPLADRMALPIGPALRLRFTSTTTFIMSSNQATTSVLVLRAGSADRR